MIRGAFTGTEYPNVASRNKYKQKRRELTVYTTITYIIFLALSIGDKFFFHPNKEWLDIFAVSTIFLILLLLINYFSVKKSYEKNQDIGDRKSTRQNSSHVAISYAVFCLKKKTTSL